MTVGGIDLGQRRREGEIVVQGFPRGQNMVLKVDGSSELKI